MDFDIPHDRSNILKAYIITATVTLCLLTVVSVYFLTKM